MVSSHWRGDWEPVTTQSIACSQNTHIHTIIKFRKIIFKTQFKSCHFLSLGLRFTQCDLSMMCVPWADPYLLWLLPPIVLPLCLTHCPFSSRTYHVPSCTGALPLFRTLPPRAPQTGHIKWNLLGLHNVINMIPVWNRALICLLIFCITSWNMNIIKVKTLFCSCYALVSAGWSCLSTSSSLATVEPLYTSLFSDTPISQSVSGDTVSERLSDNLMPSSFESRSLCLLNQSPQPYSTRNLWEAGMAQDPGSPYRLLSLLKVHFLLTDG